MTMPDDLDEATVEEREACNFARNLMNIGLRKVDHLPLGAERMLLTAEIVAECVKQARELTGYDIPEMLPVAAGTATDGRIEIVRANPSPVYAAQWVAHVIKTKFTRHNSHLFALVCSFWGPHTTCMAFAAALGSDPAGWGLKEDE